MNPSAGKDADPGRQTGNGKRVVVIGAGLVGTCTAHYLWTSGYQVTVVDEGNSPAEATSFANAGRNCPTRIMTYPQASPQILLNFAGLPFRKLRSWIDSPSESKNKNDKSESELRDLTATEDVPSSVKLNVPLISWGLWFGRNCTGARWRHNNDLLKKLTHLSGAATADLIASFSGGAASIDYAPENVWVYGTKEQQESALRLGQAASASGYSNWETLDCDECATRYPSLGPFISRVARAPGMEPSCIVAKDDYSVDSRKYALQVASLSSKSTRPIQFQFNSKVSGFDFMPGTRTVKQVMVTSVTRGSDKEEANATTCAIPTDHVVVCTGPQARVFLRDTLDINLQVQAMKGCSLDLEGVSNGPKASIADYLCGSLNFQATPMGAKHDRLRLVGFADFEDLDGEKSSGVQKNLGFIGVDPLARFAPNPNYEERLLARARLVFPGMTWTSVRRPWCGLRPLTPDGLPILGAATTERGNNVWLNVGHGSIGWTLAAGSGLMLAREILQADNLLSRGSYVERMTKRFGMETCDPLANSRFSWRAFLSPTSSSAGGSSF